MPPSFGLAFAGHLHPYNLDRTPPASRREFNCYFATRLAKLLVPLLRLPQVADCVKALSLTRHYHSYLQT